MHKTPVALKFYEMGSKSQGDKVRLGFFFS